MTKRIHEQPAPIWHMQLEQQQAEQQEQPAGEQQEQQQEQPPAATPNDAAAAANAQGADEFPADTPLDDMTDAQRAAYWKDQSKTQQKARETAERKVTDLERAALSDADRAALEAKEQIEADALVAARTAVLPELVEAMLTARGVADAADRLEFVDLSRFTNDDGTVDVAKLDRFAGIAGAGGEQQEQQRQQSPAHAFGQAGGTPPKPLPASLSLEARQARAAELKNTLTK